MSELAKLVIAADLQELLDAPAVCLDGLDAAYMQGYRNAIRDVARRLDIELVEETDDDEPKVVKCMPLDGATDIGGEA